jgi:diaminopimelate decarboxylase
MTSVFRQRDGELHVESVAATRIAEQFGTPTYVYSRAYFESRYRRLLEAFGDRPPAIRYAVKANSNLAVLDLFARLGSGFDIVSGGELERVLQAGGDPARVVFSGVGKTGEEIDFALKLPIECFNVESEAEFDRLIEHAQRLGLTAPISIRVNPDINANTHPYISTGLKENKFGVSVDLALRLYRRARVTPELEITGIDCHIGSQIAERKPLLDALETLLSMVDTLAAEGIEIRRIDLGGGLGVSYRNEPDFDIEAYALAIRERLAGRPLQLMLEPGRFLVANGGILLTRVEYLKPAAAPDERNFAIVDAAMNDLIRPTLYQAWHAVERVANASDDATERHWDLVGPICESGDFLCRDRLLRLAPGDLLCVRSAGAYGFAQSSNYNSRNRAAEVLVDGDACYLIRRRETPGDQLALESVLPAEDAATRSLPKDAGGR